MKNTSKTLNLEINEIAEDAVSLLRAKKLKVSFAESCSGGMVASSIVNIPNASEVLDVSFITYADGAKIKYLRVPEATLNEKGAVSYETAIAMARGIREEAGSNIGLGVTGIAGPTGGSLESPVGTVYIAVSSEEETIVKRFLINKSDRFSIREETTRQALIMLRDFLF